MSASSNLRKAKSAKNDEFYTQLSDIENELKHYRNHFQGKTVFCNCDDHTKSNFFQYFTLNFEVLGLKKLISMGFNAEGASVAYIFEGDTNQNGVADSDEINIIQLEGNGDFRSEESLAYLAEADIVVSNPPFSLFREYVDVMSSYKKEFLIIGSQNAISYKEIFPLMKDNKMWLGINNSGMKFEIPLHYTGGTVDTEGKNWKKLGNVCWFTNLEHSRRNDEITLCEVYEGNEEYYPSYDNYDAIEVSKVVNIPKDFDGVMGVPITFMTKYNPEQFDILGITERNDGYNQKTKIYTNIYTIKSNGVVLKSSDANARSTILYSEKPTGTCYTAEGVDGYLKLTYARILIKRK